MKIDEFDRIGDDALIESEEDDPDEELEADLYEALDLLGECRVQLEVIIRRCKGMPQRFVNWQQEKEVVDLEAEVTNFLSQWEDLE